MKKINIKKMLDKILKNSANADTKSEK